MGPLQGIRVLEMANVISGPYAGMLLADLGCEVIKVELPGTGDIFRQWDAGSGDLNPSFAAYNRGKRSVTLDVRTPGGREVYLRLASCVDVIIENFRPGTLEGMGIGYEAVRARHPGVIYCSITGLGSTGPYRNRPTFDAIAQALSGLWSQLTDLRDPEPVGPALADQLAGLFAAYGILAALLERQRTGQGRRLEVSMLAAAMAFQASTMATYLMTGEVADKLSRARRSQSYAFVASDGLPLAIHLSTPEKFWRALLEVVGLPELADDPRFRTKGDRIQNYHILHAMLAERFRTRPRAEWLARLEAHDVPAAPIYTVAEAVADVQVQHLQLVRTYGAGERAVRLVGCPVSVEGAAWASPLPPPRVGEHTEAVLRELGYSPAEIEQLRKEGAI
mgnify:CR=1 FL=1